MTDKEKIGYLKRLLNSKISDIVLFEGSPNLQKHTYLLLAEQKIALRWLLEERVRLLKENKHLKKELHPHFIKDIEQSLVSGKSKPVWKGDIIVDPKKMDYLEKGTKLGKSRTAEDKHIRGDEPLLFFCVLFSALSILGIVIKLLTEVLL
jgi:hypothetical protein